MSREIGRAEEAMEQAENAVFNAANVLHSHVAPSPDRDAVVAELADINNRLRAITGSSQLYVASGDFSFGSRWLSRAGRAWKRLVRYRRPC